MLVSGRPKRDLLSLITQQVSRPVSERGFGLVAKFEAWKAEHRPFLPEVDSQTPHSSPKRHMPSAAENAPEWQCQGCKTTDKRCLVQGSDSLLACSRCSVVACGVEMIATHREKACGAEEDGTQHADAPERERDWYSGDDVETAAQARLRHHRQAGGCHIPLKVRKQNGLCRVDSQVGRVAAAEHRSEELSPLNCNRNRALQIELVGLCKLVAPVDTALQRHVRITAHQLLLRSQIHEQKCYRNCGICLSGISAGLIAKVLLRVMAETLLPLHGKTECPFRFECSREELVGLVDRCNRLVVREGVHSALCRTACDILLHSDYRAACDTRAIPPSSGVSLAKNDSVETLSADSVGSVRDTLWSVHKTQTISDEVRDASLRSLRLTNVRKWVMKECGTFSTDIVALRLARAVNSRLHPTSTQLQHKLLLALHSLSQITCISNNSIEAEDTEIYSIINSVDMTEIQENDDDALM